MKTKKWMVKTPPHIIQILWAPPQLMMQNLIPIWHYLKLEFWGCQDITSFDGFHFLHTGRSYGVLVLPGGPHSLRCSTWPGIPDNDSCFNMGDYSLSALLFNYLDMSRHMFRCIWTISHIFCFEIILCSDCTLLFYTSENHCFIWITVDV